MGIFSYLFIYFNSILFNSMYRLNGIRSNLFNRGCGGLIFNKFHCYTPRNFSSSSTSLKFIIDESLEDDESILENRKLFITPKKIKNKGDLVLDTDLEEYKYTKHARVNKNENENE